MMFASSVIPPTLDKGKELVEFRVFREDDAPPRSLWPTLQKDGRTDG